jgi:hypothetical protein
MKAGMLKLSLLFLLERNHDSCWVWGGRESTCESLPPFALLTASAHSRKLLFLVLYEPFTSFAQRPILPLKAKIIYNASSFASALGRADIVRYGSEVVDNLKPF